MRWVARVCLALGMPLLLLLAVEGGLRLIGIGFDPHVAVREYDGTRSVYRENQAFTLRVFPPALVRSLEPFTLDACKPDGVVRVCVIGSSAAQGVPDPSFSLSRMLEVMLASCMPSTRWEVVNVGITAINSHVVRLVAQDCLEQLDADLLVVYCGNNEVIGPFGAGTVFSRAMPSQRVIRAVLWLRSLRLGQVLTRMLGSRGVPAGWGGMSMFLRHRVGVDDPRLLTVYAHFQQNLKDICAAAARHDAGVVLCTVGVNLRDCPPFASLHGTGVTSAIALAWSNDIAAAEAAEHAGDNSKAAGHYRMALQRDPLHAETHYRAARLLGAVGDAVATGDHFALARDDDALRFRADSVINRIIRMTAAAQTGRVALADIEHVFAAASASGSPGNDLFFEHVHLTFDGTWLAASTMAARVVALLAAPTSAGRLPTAQECREQLGYTAWDEYRITREIARDFLQSPPFTAQLEHTVRVAAAQTRLAALQTGFTARVVAQIEAAYRRVLTRRPDDWQVRSNLAGFLLTARRKPAEAVVELQRVLAATPHNAGVLQTLARTYLQMRQSADAIAACRRSLRIMPWNATTYNDLGIALLQTNDAKAAARAFRSALRCDPSNAQAHCNLGIVALSQGDSVAAVRHFSDGLTITPDDPDLHKNLATAYARHNAWADAERHYRIAVRDGAASADVFAGLGICLIRLGRPYEAIDVLRYALALQPDLAQARAALAAAQAELSAAPRQLPK